MPSQNETDIIKTSESILICAFNCTEQNVKNCRKCTRPFCIMHCNTFTPNFCKDCFKDLAVISDKFKRTFDYIGDNGQLYIKTEERVRYYLDGMDWPFVTPWINSLSDDELRSLWVFHHYIMRLIETENDTRNVEKNRKLRESPVPRLISGATTTTRTIKTTKPTQPETAESIRAKLKKSGISDMIIDNMIKAMNL
jgi:hypothetical protein